MFTAVSVGSVGAVVEVGFGVVFVDTGFGVIVNHVSASGVFAGVEAAINATMLSAWLGHLRQGLVFLFKIAQAKIDHQSG